MLCVTIACDELSQMRAKHRELVAQGVRLVELRLDYLRGEIVDLRKLLEDRPGPVIVACRRPQDGGRFAAGEAQRLALLRMAIALGADYVDLEDDVAVAIPRSGQGRRIVSLHDFEKTPDDLAAIHRRLAALDPDIVKICTMARSPHDNLRVLQMVAAAKVPTVGFCMGEIGVASRILAGRFGAPWTYVACDGQSAVAPGQVSFPQMRDLYRYDAIGPATEVYGVVADPVGHSLSPLIHNTAFRELQLDKVYLPFRVPPADLAQFMDDAPQLGVRGLSVTIPHKEAILPKLGQAETAVRGIGACNTAVFDGRQWCGYNTDCQAAMASLEEALGGPRGGAGSVRGRTALVLGAGGVGKAIAYGLVSRQADVVLCDGAAERAEQLAKRLQCRWVKWEDRRKVEADVVIHGTPIGMHPHVDETPLAAADLRPSTVVFDAVYNPEETMLLRGARQRGCTVVSGVEMFVRQACLQFKLFTGHDGPAALMRDVIKQALAVKVS
jgi:3-dehydroquinate dehydratase/shikimate dehydrogenase